ncbi:hypothetical protein GDO78_005740 [Eleutherodactylus coqui]|uniref:Uncharacterized protein n=1 Tax=Eleutherodactylus coqui TaxID=57060 RepID=A0A8J6KF58_ELECQ|nr:hypothetical protein GDO78_005740 [Eleutherodactylus coqui]KAG9489982.1 hypothetical protein GDO78_005740 [Eleutherodactylus coqui]
MSSFGEERSEISESSAEEEEEEDDLHEKPLSALPPFTAKEESPKDVTASPAFQCLDELSTASGFKKTPAPESDAQKTESCFFTEIHMSNCDFLI